MTTFCRLCLQKSPDMLPLFEAVIGEKLLIEIILSTFGVELENSLNFPSQVCQDCFKNVDLLYGFYNKLIETQSLLSQRIKEGKTIVGAMHQTNTFNPQENDCETFEHHEKEQNNHQNSFAIETDEFFFEIGNNNDMPEFIQEQIEQEEPIIIKNELLNSDYEDVDDDETTQNNDNEKNLTKMRRKNKRNPKEVQTIPNKCYICGPILESKDEFLAHLEGHKDMLPHECLQCTTATNPIILPDVIILNKHIETHSFKYICKLCPQRFRAGNTLSYHRRTAHNDPTFKHHCLICGKVFNNAVRLQTHVYQHKYPKRSKEVQTIPNKCYICDSVFVGERIFNDHLNSHKKMLPYECSQCTTATNPIILSTLAFLNRHFETHSFNYVCRQCPLRFRTSARLSYHKQTVHEKQASKHCCDSCGKVFFNSVLFRSHIRGHIYLDTQRYKCEICQKLFRSQFDLQRHELIHTKRNGQFVCKWCDRTFDTVVRCMQHMERRCKANEKRNEELDASDLDSWHE